MEIAVLPKQALKLKGKKSLFILNPQDKLDGYNAAIYVHPIDSYESEIVKIAGAGDYEVAGVKIAGTRTEDSIVYSLKIDEIDVLLGEMNALDKMQHKLKEHNIVVLLCNEKTDASFATSLAINTVLFYGSAASEVVHTFAKENVLEMNKYQVTADKLSNEMQTVLLK